MASISKATIQGFREAAINQIREAAAYVSAHAEDFVAREGSDEIIAEDGLALRIKVVYNGVPTVTIEREVIAIDLAKKD